MTLGSLAGVAAALALALAGAPAGAHLLAPSLLEVREGEAGRVDVRWRVTYRVVGAPELVLAGEEAAWFEGDRIRKLEDRFGPEAGPTSQQYFEAHGEKLKPV